MSTAWETPFSLEGRIAIVTGAAKGIGREIASRFARAGAAVVANDVDGAALEASVAELGLAAGVAGDVRDPAAVARVVEAAVACGAVDILVNNAGLMRDNALYRMTDEQWDLVLDVNLRGAFNFIRACAPVMRERFKSADRHTKIINIVSTIGLYGQKGSANYAAAKAGLVGLTKSVARELAGQKTNVNAIAPGHIAGTELLATRREGAKESIPEGLLEQLASSIPLGRAGAPSDIAMLAQFLAAESSDFITGQVIEAHGGREIMV